MSVAQPTANMSQENNYDQIFDEDVQRFEATEYKQRYGERWKKLATSVRDVVQPDGTIIREYVIEDPSLLEQLSEDEDNVSSIDTNTKTINPVTTTLTNNTSNLSTGQTSLPLKMNNTKNTSSFKLYSSNNKTNDKGEKYFQPINKKEDDEIDKEVEIIHEQGEQLKKYVSSKDLTQQQQQQSVEYEIVDENGNQILINGAEQLKSLAAQVNEVVQPDGSIVKEYVLNDPKIIEQIRSRLKTETNISKEETNSIQIAPILAAPTLPPPPPPPQNVIQPNVIKPQPVASMINYDTLSTTNATISSIVNDTSSKQSVQQPVHTQPQIKTNKLGVPNISETILYKKDKPAKQEEFINAWCTNNDGIKLKPNSPPSVPFLAQIQHQIQKLQKKTSVTSNDNNLSNSKQVNTLTETNQLQNKIASQLSDKYVAEIDYHSSQPINNQSFTKSKLNEQTNCELTCSQPQIIKKNGKNIFQLKTKKGKALQFTITSDDPTESDIEEVKYIINKSIENLADNYEQDDDKHSFSKHKQSTQSAQNFSDHYVKSSSFQPSNQITHSSHETNTCSNSSGGTASFCVPKSGSIGCFKTNEPKNFLNANSSQIKHYPNMNPITNSSKIYHVDATDEKRYSKNLHSSNSGSNENIYTKHSNNNASYQTHESIVTKKHSTRFDKNSYLRRSNSFSNGHDSTSSDTDINYNNNINLTPTNNIKNKSNIKQSNSSNSNSKKQTIFNGGTYTKSTINFTCQSYDSDFNEIDEQNRNKKHSSKSNKNKSKPNNSNYSQMNKSTNNIYDSHIRDVTPEMTEQLLLKLLLQQISQKDYNLQTFKRLNQNIVKEDYSSNSTIYNKNIVSEAASLMMSPVDSSYSSKFNSIKNKLTHKSKNNFDFEADEDYDDITNNNQYHNRRYQTGQQVNSQYMTQQQLLIKKPLQQQQQLPSRTKKYTN